MKQITYQIVRTRASSVLLIDDLLTLRRLDIDFPDGKFMKHGSAFTEKAVASALRRHYLSSPEVIFAGAANGHEYYTCMRLDGSRAIAVITNGGIASTMSEDDLKNTLASLVERRRQVEEHIRLVESMVRVAK